MQNHSFLENRDAQALIKYLVEKYDSEIDKRILNIYQFGSRVYGTSNKNSDYDFIIVTSSKDIPGFNLS